MLWIRPGIFGFLFSLFLLFLLPTFSDISFKLYHLVNFEPFYFLYTAFKAASVYYPRWEYFELSAISAGVILTLTVKLLQNIRNKNS